MSNKSKKVDIKVIVSYVLCVTIAVGLVIGNYYALKYQNLISVHFNQSNQKIVSADGEAVDYYTSDYDSEEARTEHLRQVGQDIEAEGIVLLKNESNALPLASGSKISVSVHCCAGQTLRLRENCQLEILYWMRME